MALTDSYTAKALSRRGEVVSSAPPFANARRVAPWPLTLLKQIGLRLEPYDYVRIPTALLLLLAAVLKVMEVAAGPDSLDLSAPGAAVWLQPATVSLEMGVGVVLLVNKFRRLTWVFTVGLFVVFAVISATGIAEGKETCGCFGSHSPSPSTVLVLDLFVIFALVMTGPPMPVSRWWWFQPRERLVYVGGIGTLLLVWQAATAMVPRPLHIDQRYLDIGAQWEQENFKWVLPVRNKRDEPVEVTGISSSCTCTSIEPDSVTIPPHASVDIKLTLNLADRKRLGRTREASPFSILLMPQLRGGSPAPIEWRLTGTTRRLVDGLPASIEFPKGTVELGRPVPTKRFQIRSRLPLRRVLATFHPPLFHANVMRNPGSWQEFTIEIEPVVDGTTGYRASELRLNLHHDGEAGENDLQVSLSIPAEAWITSDVEIVPTTLQFGALPMASSATEVIEIVSQSGAAYTIDRLHVDGVSANLRELIAGQRYQCTIVADAEGDRLGKLRVSVAPECGGDKFELVKSIRYFGVPSRTGIAQ